ncbi:MAG: EAL domain-containing protein [Rhodanobacter sp.]
MILPTYRNQLTPLRRRLAAAAGWGAGFTALALVALLTLHAIGLREPLPGALLLLAAVLATYFAGLEGGLMAALLTVVIMVTSDAPFDEIPGGVVPIFILVLVQLIAIALIGFVTRRVAAAARNRLASEGQARAATASHAEQALRLVLDNIPQRVFWKDAEGRYLGCNTAFARDAGFASSSELIGKTDFDMAWKEDASAYRAKDAAVLDGGGTDVAYEEPQHQPDGSVMWLRTSKVPMLGPDGRAIGVLGTYEDITEQRQTDERLRIAANAQEFALEAVMTLDLSGCIISVNQAFTTITGYTSEEAIGRNPAFLRSERYPPSFYEHIWEVTFTSGRWQGELWRRHRDGSPQLVQTSFTAVRDGAGSPTHCVVVFGDISKARSDAERVTFLAYHDPLTGLSNRAAFVEAIQGALARSERDQTCLAVMFLDLDSFKPVNDSLGHAIGDEVLQQVGARLSAAVRKTDVVARLGGDEFGIMMEGVIGPTECAALANKLLDVLATPYCVSAHELFVTASIGISFSDVGSDSMSMLKNADVAMYEAKRDGKRRYHIFSDNLDSQGHRGLTLTNELHHALERCELSLLYQPKVTPCDGRIVGFEALTRWTSEKLGTVSPVEFIPIAENSGLIGPMGDWALRVACAQAREWAAQAPGLVVSVNVSARQLRIPNFVERLAEILRDTHLEPKNLEIEITESVLISEPERAIKTLRRIRDMGVAVALDDFGTGYSSLSYLKRLPVDLIKIDQSFMSDLPQNEGDVALLRGIIALAKALNLVVVAEGVETEEQRALLCEAGCDLAQGYLFACPLSAVDAGAMLGKFYVGQPRELLH